MNILGPQKIVVLGMMTQHTVAGHIWAVMHYLVGLRRLGYDVYYVEAHSCWPKQFFKTDDEDGWSNAAAFIADIMERFDFKDRWAFHDTHHDQCYGLSLTQLKQLYGSAALLINMHGGTEPRPEHTATGRLVFIDTDPGKPQIQLQKGEPWITGVLASHNAWFTYAENIGQADCRLPTQERFPFKTMRAPIVLDFWEPHRDGDARKLTTVGSWKQLHREASVGEENYHWSKHFEFLKFIDLPRRTEQQFELALSKCDEADQRMLESHGWQVLAALDFSDDLDAYRSYIAGSRGEFTVSKDQYVRLRTGWFSNRSNTYLASGRPVITQDTGFSRVLPTGEGLFGFSTMDDVLLAVDAINSDYERHCDAALAVAREYFSYEVVLPRFLAEVGL